MEIAVDLAPVQGLADSGDLEYDLAALFAAVGTAAAERRTAMILFIDELQYLPEAQLASLITALHAASQAQLPITMIGAGLPQVLRQMGQARSYAERLFEYAKIDHLGEAARAALTLPASREGMTVSGLAVAEILRCTSGYPYFLQEWGKHSWNVAKGSAIILADAERATAQALAELDASFFRVRFDNLTPSERRYRRAMAELGSDPRRSGDIAIVLQRKVTTVAPLRNALIAKGMLYSPAHGDTAFTVPMFDGFMRRIMPTL